MLYLECSSGISGDMTVAALLDAGASEDVLRRALDSLPVEGFSVQVGRVKKSGLDACDFAVLLDEEHENHDHDMAYLHGPAGEPPHGHGHVHGHDRAHDHARGGASPNDHARGHSHPHAHEDESPHAPAHDHARIRSHEHRGLPEILAIIEAADMSERAKATARRVFQVLAEAEAAAHGVGVDEVHFHEVGAVDSIADVVAAAVCLDDLDVTDVVVPVLCEGQGTVRCQHGVIPVPVPAVVNVAAAHGIPLRILDVQGELVTPTGAALVAAVRTRPPLCARKPPFPGASPSRPSAWAPASAPTTPPASCAPSSSTKIPNRRESFLLLYHSTVIKYSDTQRCEGGVCPVRSRRVCRARTDCAERPRGCGARSMPARSTRACRAPGARGDPELVRPPNEMQIFRSFAR